MITFIDVNQQHDFNHDLVIAENDYRERLVSIPHFTAVLFQLILQCNKVIFITGIKYIILQRRKPRS